MMIRITALAVVMVALFASTSFAGKIFGDIKMDGKPLPEGVVVTIALAPAADADKNAAATALDTTKTDKFGSYKFTVKPEGKCVLTVVHEKQTASLDVFSYKEATRYDLILEKKEGKLSLRRK